MNKSIKNLVNLFLFLFILNSCNNEPAVKVAQIKCNSTVEPVGTGTACPEFSWLAESNERGGKQSAYQIIVADNEADINKNKGTLWDSGKVGSGMSHSVKYNGTSLESNKKYFWKVKIWDEKGNETGFSQAGSFLTSVLDEKLWKAGWIGAGAGKDPVNEKGFYKERVEVDSEGDSVVYNGNSLLLRGTYNLSKPIEKAIANICGLGLYESSINGKKVGDKLLNPAKTHFNRIVLYDTYDVSGFFNDGENALGIMLGNGWFNPIPKWWSWRMQWFGEKRAMLQVNLTYKDGSTEIISTDAGWKMKEGPVRLHCLYDGETYDANMEQTGWDEPGFDDSNWENAKTVAPPKGKLTAQIMPAIKHVETIKPVQVTYPAEGLALVDFGQNFSGWVRIKLRAEKGDTVSLRYAEDKKDGMLDPSTNERAIVNDIFISNGEEKIYEPCFTYHGFQFAEISGLGYKLQPDDIEGIVVHSAVEPIGTFECGNEEINRLHKAILWSQRANLMGFPTDCPQREERLGWSGDAHVTAEEAIFNFDMDLFYAKWLRDLRINQDITGDIPYIAPRPLSENPAYSWSSGFHLVSWYHYLYYGDAGILKDNYEAMKRYVDFLYDSSEGFILPLDRYGDWVSPLEGWERGGPMLTSTAYFYCTASIVAKVANILDVPDDEQKYGSLAENVKKAFNQEYYDTEKKYYEDGSQFANSFALFLGLVPETEKAAVLANLVGDIKDNNNMHLTTGILGTKYLMELLSEQGRSDIAWELATQNTYPSWLDMLKGHNTLCERWRDVKSSSHNHVMLGSIDSWFYKYIAGIQPDENAPGFKNIIINPYMPNDLDWAKASTNTVMGEVKSEWSKNAGVYTLNVKIPFGSEATVYVPANSAGEVKESGKLATEAEDVKYLRTEAGHSIFQVGSGEYVFSSVVAD